MGCAFDLGPQNGPQNAEKWLRKANLNRAPQLVHIPRTAAKRGREPPKTLTLAGVLFAQAA